MSQHCNASSGLYPTYTPDDGAAGAPDSPYNRTCPSRKEPKFDWPRPVEDEVQHELTYDNDSHQNLTEQWTACVDIVTTLG